MELNTKLSMIPYFGATLVCICVIIFLPVLVIRCTNKIYDPTRKQEVTTLLEALLSSGVFKTSFQL